MKTSSKKEKPQGGTKWRIPKRSLMDILVLPGWKQKGGGRETSLVPGDYIRENYFEKGLVQESFYLPLRRIYVVRIDSFLYFELDDKTIPNKEIKI